MFTLAVTRPEMMRARRALAHKRRGLAKAVARLLTNSVAAGMPKNAVESIQKSLWDPSVAQHVRGMQLARLPLIASYHVDGRPPHFRTSHAFPEKTLFRLSDVTASPFSGLVWTDEQVFVESVGSVSRAMEWGSALDDTMLPAKRLPDASEVMVCPDVGFYHWILEALPNVLLSVTMIADLTLLVSADAPGYVRESIKVLEEAGLCRSRSISGPVRVRKLTMVSLYAEGGFIHPDDLAMLRAKFLPLAINDRTRKDMRRRFYVSRRRTAKRSWPDEVQIEYSLADAGYEIVYAEDLTLSEQLRLFAAAEVVVAPHGAGLANLVWAPPDCVVVELFRPTYENDCYAVLSASLGIKYLRVLLNEGLGGNAGRKVLSVLAQLNDGM